MSIDLVETFSDKRLIGISKLIFFFSKIEWLSNRLLYLVYLFYRLKIFQNLYFLIIPLQIRQGKRIY